MSGHTQKKFLSPNALSILETYGQNLFSLFHSDGKTAVFPSEWNKENKFWPYVSRIDNAFGDRNFFCVCPDINSYKE
mgnify:CR=1 FL=1